MFTKEQYRCLQHGYKFFDDAHYYDGRSLWKSESLRTEMAGAWQFLRPQLLAEWTTLPTRAGYHGGPGTRPAGWWVYDAPERLRRIDGKPHPFDNPERQAKIAGILAQYPQREDEFYYLFWGWIGAYVVPDDSRAVRESDFAYLTRLNLLLPGEEELYAERLRLESQREAERKEREQLEDMGL